MTESENNKTSFEQSLQQLEVLAKKLESGDCELDEAIKIYEQGTSILKSCEKTLDEAKLKVEMIVKNANGEAELKPFEAA